MAVLALVVIASSFGGAMSLVGGSAQAMNSASALVQTIVDGGVIAPVIEIVGNAITPARPAPGDLTNPSKSAPNASQALGIALWKSSPISGPTKDTPLANFGVVEEGIVYRAAQPSDSDYDWLLGRGFKSTVNLRRERGDDRDFLLKRGFRNQLWLDIEDETAPTDEQAERFLEFIADSRNWPVLLHCKVGLGRTGTMAALIRYSIDGWSMEEALKEARIYRGGVSLVRVQVDWLNRWATNYPPGSHRLIVPDTSSPDKPPAFAPAS